VRDDSRVSDFLFQSSVTTYNTYNQWSDVKDANGKFINYGSYTVPQASKVSFNRPYQYQNPENSRIQNGAGFFFEWESSMSRFMEREGYDVTYNTNIDTHANGGQLLNHKAFLSVGHDEYWSKEIRDNVEAARNAGVNLAFLGANAAYWQIRLEPGSAASGGAANRNVVAYRYQWALDPAYLANPQSPLVTRLWRDLNRPEAALIGVQYLYNSLDLDMVISDCTSPLCNGTVSPSNPALRLQPGDTLFKMLGYEVDAVAPSSPANIQIIATSPFTCLNSASCVLNSTLYSHMTYYVAPSGAKVFATGSMNWNFGVDNGSPYANGRVNENVKTITRNVFNGFIGR
jgi:hypothetical protein